MVRLSVSHRLDRLEVAAMVTGEEQLPHLLDALTYAEKYDLVAAARRDARELRTDAEFAAYARYIALRCQRWFLMVLGARPSHDRTLNTMLRASEVGNRCYAVYGSRLLREHRRGADDAR